MKVHTGYQTNKFCKEPPQLYRRRGGVKTGEAKVLTFRKAFLRSQNTSSLFEKFIKFMKIVNSLIS
jgi:hypothetical protein